MENKNYRSRYLKVVVFNSTNDIGRIESTVNHTVDSLKAAHAKSCPSQQTFTASVR